MARKVFFSFHYKPDNWRASQVRNIGAIEGNAPVSDNDWESVTRGGDKAIENWINNQLWNRSCTVVLVGSNTAGRKWINYEIKKSWETGKGLVGIHIHNLKDRDGNQSFIGGNPFDGFSVNNKPLSSIVRLYNPPYLASTNVYAHIKNNIEDWVEEAIGIRNEY